MKYSLKNKEFSRKKHNIFDNHTRRSRTKSASPTPKKQASNSKDNIQMQFTISVKPPSLNQTAIDKLNSLDSQGNSFHIRNNEQEQSMFQSFSRVQPMNLTSKQPFISTNITTNSNAIKPSQPIKFILPSKTSSELKQKHVSEYSEPKSESFQVCEDDNSSRVNRFFAESILARESESPMNKVVFEPVIRKSVSQEPKSLSPEPKIYQQQLNKVTPINLKIQPDTREHHYQPQNFPLIERKVSIVQIPRQAIKVESQRLMQNHVISPLHQINDIISQNKFQAEEISDLRNKVEQQNLQIQYLKNQKQILESNIELRFSPKKVSYLLNNQQQPRTPQKYNNQASPVINNQKIDRNKIVELAQILKHNQAKIMFLERKYQSFYAQIYHKFNESLLNCQDLLIKMFSQKYYSFTEQLNAKMFLIDQKSTQVVALDHKIDVFTNTFRSIEENLRITKLKQQNVQLLIENKYKKSDRFWNKEEGSRMLLMENQSDISSIRIFNDNQMEEKDRDQLKKLQKNLKQKGSNSQWIQNRPEEHVQFDSFLDDKYSHLVYNPKKQQQQPRHREQKSNQKHRKSHHFKRNQKSLPKKQLLVSQIYDESEKKKYNHNKSASEEIQQFSPFQANQMFRNQYRNASSTNGTYLKYSEATPNNDFTSSNAKRQSINNNKSQKNRVNLSSEDTSSKNYDFNENSFEVEMDYKNKPKNLLQKEISFTSQNMFKKNLNKTSSQNEDISDTLKGEQERLVKILKSKNYQFPIECWLDELGCLRKKNQTYIFDDQGSVIMTTSAAFKKLKQKRILL